MRSKGLKSRTMLLGFGGFWPPERAGCAAGPRENTKQTRGEAVERWRGCGGCPPPPRRLCRQRLLRRGSFRRSGVLGWMCQEGGVVEREQRGQG